MTPARLLLAALVCWPSGVAAQPDAGKTPALYARKPERGETVIDFGEHVVLLGVTVTFSFRLGT